MMCRTIIKLSDPIIATQAGSTGWLTPCQWRSTVTQAGSLENLNEEAELVIKLSVLSPNSSALTQA